MKIHDERTTSGVTPFDPGWEEFAAAKERFLASLGMGTPAAGRRPGEQPAASAADGPGPVPIGATQRAI